MARLPVVSGAETIAALERVGFVRHRQKGSHVAMVRRAPHVQTVTVPLHKELAQGTLRSIIRQAELTVEEFAELVD